MPKGDNLDINQILGFWRLKLNDFARGIFSLKYAEADFPYFRSVSTACRIC